MRRRTWFAVVLVALTGGLVGHWLGLRIGPESPLEVESGTTGTQPIDLTDHPITEVLISPPGKASIRFLNSCDGSVASIVGVVLFDDDGNPIFGKEEEGLWQFEVGERPLQVTVTHDDVWFAPINLGVLLKPGEITQLSVAATLEVVGHVIEEETGRPISGLSVTAVSRTNGEILSTGQTTATGDFTLRDVPPLPVELWFEGEGWVKWSMDVVVPCSGLLLELPIEMQPGFRLNVAAATTWPDDVQISVSSRPQIIKGKKAGNGWAPISSYRELSPGEEYTFDRLPRGCVYLACAQRRSPGFAEYDCQLIEEAMEDHPFEHSVVLTPGTSKGQDLVLQLVDETGQEVRRSDVKVILHPTTVQGLLVKVPFHEGKLRVSGFDPGDCYVRLDPPAGVKSWIRAVKIAHSDEAEVQHVEIPLRKEIETPPAVAPSDVIVARVAQRWLERKFHFYCVDTGYGRMLKVRSLRFTHSPERYLVWSAASGHTSSDISIVVEVDGSYWARDFTMPPATSTGRELVVTFGDDSWQRVGGGITVKGKIEEPSLSLRNGSITCNATGTFWPGELASGRTDIDGVFELQLPPVPLSTATLEWSHDSGQIRGEFEFDLSGDVIDLGELIPN